MLGSFKLALFPIITLSCFKMESIDQLNTIITLLLYVVNQVARQTHGPGRPGSSQWWSWNLFLFDFMVVACLSFIAPLHEFPAFLKYIRNIFYCKSSLPCMVVVIVPSIQRLRPSNSPSPKLSPSPTLLSGAMIIWKVKSTQTLSPSFRGQNVVGQM